MYAAAEKKLSNYGADDTVFIRKREFDTYRTLRPTKTAKQIS